MPRLVSVVLTLALVFLTACVRTAQVTEGAPVGALEPTVILISFDGWRWDYHTKGETTNLRTLIARGVRAEGLIPVFPSKTFPNHYSIITGLYPEHHGVVSNAIRDPESGRVGVLTRGTEARNAMWFGGEPFWNTVQKAGQRAASMFWPGADAPIGGTYPRYRRPFDEGVPAAERVDQVLRWLDLPAAERPTFITLYFSDTDDAGHATGPDSPETRSAIGRLDQNLGLLLSGLRRRGILERVNLVLVSDHGMAATSPDRVVVLDDYVSVSSDEVVDINPTLGLAPRPGRLEEIYRALAQAHPRLKVYRREETPLHWHYRAHERIPPIVGVVDDGWQVLRRATLESIVNGKARASRGQHGYDPAVAPSMHGLFVAAGPAFKQGVTVPPFENVHVYNLLATILDVPPAPNDGDPALARSLLR